MAGAWGNDMDLERDDEEASRQRPPHRRHKAPVGECKYCDDERSRNADFHPPHDASPRCESGKHPHCTCDTCF